MDRPTVSCVLMGGLGNQLFQIFTTISYGLLHGKRICIPYSDSVSIGRTRPTYWKNLLSRLITFTSSERMQFPRYNESSFSYSAIPEFGGSVTLYGYFQSPRYFDSHKSTILRMIGFEQIQASIEEKYMRRNGDEYIVAMHFRRGDYKTLPNHYALLDADYYARAVRDICERVPKRKFRIQYYCEAEDLTDVQQMIHRIHYLCLSTLQQMDCQLVWESAPNAKGSDANACSDWEQMVMMSLSDVTIIANSTFSWWGAYLNSRAFLQYCPKVWFGPALAGNDMSTFYPEKWISM